MQYFDGTEDKTTRIGKVIGDTFSALVYLSIFALMLTIVMR